MLLQKAKNFSKSNLFKYISAEFLGVIISFLISTYILIYLGAKELGLFTFYMILVSLFSSIAQGAANSYLMKNFFKQDKNKTISSVNLTMAVFSFLAVFIYLATENYFESYYYTSYFIVFALLKAYNSTTFVVMRLNEDANSFFVWSILNKSLYSLPIVHLILQESFTIGKFLFVLFLNEILFFILLYGYIIFKYKYSFQFELNYWKENLKLSTNLFPHKIFKTIYENIDKYAIQFLLGLEALGIYSMILRLASPITMFIKSSNNELAVVMSKVYSKKASLSLMIRTEKRIYILLGLVNFCTLALGTIYHNYIYNLGGNFYQIYFLALLVTNNLIYNYTFYNMCFLIENKIIYYVMGLNITLFLSGLFLLHNDSIEILSLFLLINILSSMIMYIFLGKKNILIISKRLFISFFLISMLIVIAGGL